MGYDDNEHNNYAITSITSTTHLNSSQVTSSHLNPGTIPPHALCWRINSPPDTTITTPGSCHRCHPPLPLAPWESQKSYAVNCERTLPCQLTRSRQQLLDIRLCQLLYTALLPARPCPRPPPHGRSDRRVSTACVNLLSSLAAQSTTPVQSGVLPTTCGSLVLAWWQAEEAEGLGMSGRGAVRCGERTGEEAEKETERGREGGQIDG